MKIRIGFVSNSSSSSFLVFYKGRKPTAKTVAEKMGASPRSAAFKVLIKVLEPLFVDSDEVEESDLADEHVKLLDDGWKVYRVSASDEDAYAGAEVYLCHNGDDVECDLDDVKIVFNGGY